LLWFVQPDRAFVSLAIILAAIAIVSYTSATVFNNALLPDIVPEECVGRLSGWAWGLEYLGGLAALVLTLFVFMQHEFSWLNRGCAQHVRIVGPLVALWFAVFMWPLFLWTPDRAGSGQNLALAIRKSFGTLKVSLGQLVAHKNILWFLAAQMSYADALVAIFTFGGLYAAGTFGMTITQVTGLGILLNVMAGLGAFAFA
jgi:MFS transporter, UMF1 family